MQIVGRALLLPLFDLERKNNSSRRFSKRHKMRGTGLATRCILKL
jgi:hypothetical protein